MSGESISECPAGSRMIRVVGLSLVCILTGCGGGGAGGNGAGAARSVSAKVTWMAPSSKTDGSTLDDLAGYRIYYNSTPTGRWNEIEVMNPSAITWTVDNLRPGTWYFMMTAFNEGGAESDYTEVVSVNLQ